MKTKIKITIGDNIYEVESSYESGLSTVKELIEGIIKQELLLQESKKS